MFDRSKYRASEMPQAFRYEIIKKAYEQVCLAATLYLLRKERLRHFPRIPILLLNCKAKAKAILKQF